MIDHESCSKILHVMTQLFNYFFGRSTLFLGVKSPLVLFLRPTYSACKEVDAQMQAEDQKSNTSL